MGLFWLRRLANVQRCFLQRQWNHFPTQNVGGKKDESWELNLTPSVLHWGDSDVTNLRGRGPNTNSSWGKLQAKNILCYLKLQHVWGTFYAHFQLYRNQWQSPLGCPENVPLSTCPVEIWEKNKRPAAGGAEWNCGLDDVTGFGLKTSQHQLQHSNPGYCVFSLDRWPVPVP